MKSRKIGIAVLALALGTQLPFAALTAHADNVVSAQNSIAFYSGESAVSYYIDGNSVLYASGNNGNGELGIGTQGGVRYTPVKVMENVSAVADGKSGFALAVTSDGKLYGWGRNEYAQLGQDTAYNEDAESNRVTSPVEIPLPGGAVPKAVAAGESFSVVLTEAGEVLTCGRAGDGQTGLSGLTLSRRTVVGKMTKIDQSAFGGEKIVSVDAAENTGFALTESGKLYLWGANDKGILGGGSLDEGEIYETPTLLAFDEKIEEVSAETMNVLVRTQSGKVYGWGDNSVGQLGSASFTEQAAASPVEISSYYDPQGQETEIAVSSVLCGGRTNFVLSADGRVFAFGAAGNGQAGCNLRSEAYLSHPCVRESNVVLPLQIRFYAPVSLETASEEVLAEYADKSPVDLGAPIDVEVSRLIGSIGDRTFVCDSEGNVWSWGVNLYAMTCSGDALDCTSPVRSTLFRKENYDRQLNEKNYMIKPAVVMSIVVVLAAAYFISAEIKTRRIKRLFAEEEKLRQERVKEGS